MQLYTFRGCTPPHTAQLTSFGMYHNSYECLHIKIIRKFVPHHASQPHEQVRHDANALMLKKETPHFIFLSNFA